MFKWAKIDYLRARYVRVSILILLKKVTFFFAKQDLQGELQTATLSCLIWITTAGAFLRMKADQIQKSIWMAKASKIQSSRREGTHRGSWSDPECTPPTSSNFTPLIESEQ
jgi:hypothetical protein